MVHVDHVSVCGAMGRPRGVVRLAVESVRLEDEARVPIGVQAVSLCSGPFAGPEGVQWEPEQQVWIV